MPWASAAQSLSCITAAALCTDVHVYTAFPGFYQTWDSFLVGEVQEFIGCLHSVALNATLHKGLADKNQHFRFYKKYILLLFLCHIYIKNDKNADTFSIENDLKLVFLN